MDNQAKIAELKKNINNKFFPEALKPKLKLQIEALQKEINAENDKAKPKQSTNLSFEDWLKSKKIEIYKRTYYWVADDGGKDYMYSGKKTAIMKSLREDWKKEIGSENDKAKPKQSKTSVAKIDGMPKFVIGDIVVLKGETTLEKEIIDRRMNNKNQYVYKAKYVSKPSETGEWNESELELFNSNGKGILSHPKPKFKAGDTISFTVASNKPEVLVGKLEYRDSYGLFTVVDGREYELKKLLEVKLITKPKKPTVARTVKSELKKYYAHREIKTVTVIEDGKKVVYKGEDVLNGAQFLAKGGKVDEIATYYPIRAIVEVTLDNGEKVKPANGYHIKNGAKPIAELGATLATEEIINNSIVDYHNPRFAYAKGGMIEYSEQGNVKSIKDIDGKRLQEIEINGEKFKYNSTYKTYNSIVNNKVLTNEKYEDGGEVPGSFDFDYIAFLDEMQPKIAAILKKKGVKMNELYEISYKGHRLLPEVLSSYVDETPDKLIVGYFDQNYVPFGEFGSIEFELQEKEFHIRFPQLKVNDVEMYAKGGKSKTYMSLDEFREKLNEMSNDELLTYYCKEFGFDVNDNQIIEQVENERDSVIDELLDDYQAMMRTSGRFYAKGGWTKDYKYLNKSEDYEVRYAKGKNRKGYAEKGMETVDFDYKNKYSPLKIRNVNDVEKFFNYLMNDEKLSFHPDNKFEGNMQDNLSKEQAITLDKYVSDCFDVCEENKIDIYGLAANPMFLKLAKGGRIDTFLNKKAEEIVKYYLNDSVTPNEVFSQLELKEKGDYVIEKDGNDWFLEICFGNEYEKATTELKDNYSSFISHVENETDGKYFYDLQALTDDNLKSVMFLFEKPKYEKGGKIKTFDYKTEYNPSKIKNPNDVKEFFKYLVNVEKVNFHPDDDFDDYIDFKTKKKLFSKKEAQNLDQYMEDSFLVMDLPKNKDKEIYTIGLEVMEEYKALGGDVELPSGSFEQYMIYREKGGNISVGRLAKGKTLEEIATIHGVLVSEIEKQMDLGEKVEMEHTTDVNIARAIAKDHVFENPNYYTLLENLEKPKSKRTPPKTTRKNQPGAGSPIFALAKQIRTAGMTWKEAVEKAKEQLKK